MRGTLLKALFFCCALQTALSQAPPDGTGEKIPEKQLPVEQMLSARPLQPADRTAVNGKEDKARKSAFPEPSPLAKPNTDRTFPFETLTAAPPPARPPAIRSTLRLVEPIAKDAANLALKGFDPVAYHTLKQPQKGKEELSTKWRDATWRFASEEHRQLFLEDPERYAPQYGGYCAYGMTRGAALPIDPERWSVEGGKLYLFHDSTLENLWVKDSLDLIPRANATWPRIQRKKALTAGEDSTKLPL